MGWNRNHPVVLSQATPASPLTKPGVAFLACLEIATGIACPSTPGQGGFEGLQAKGEVRAHARRVAYLTRTHLLIVRPAACRIKSAISCGCEINDRWLEVSSIVVAPIRFAMNRSRSGLMVRSSVETA